MCEGRFAAKKMKRLLGIPILFLLFSGHISAQGKNSVGADIASAICSGAIRISFAHRIADRWTAGAETGIYLKGIEKSGNDEYTSHMQALEDNDSPEASGTSFRDDFIETSVLAGFWPRGAFTGPKLTFGCTFKDRSGMDICAGGGYNIKIWKGLGADISYSLGLRETIRTKKPSLKGLRIGIIYIF